VSLSSCSTFIFSDPLLISWHLGSCTPASLLGENAYLPLKQSRMKSLSIATNPSCWNSSRESLDLWRFRHLRSISWMGLSRASDFAEFYGVLLRNEKNLHDLKLDVKGSQRSALIRSLTTRQSPFHEIPNRFQSLRILYLTGVVFKSITSDAISSLNIGRLESLTLHECPEVGEFLTTSIRVVQPTLKSFELFTYGNPLGSPSTLDTFLRGFQSLKRLYLSVDARSFDPKTIWTSVAHHQSTLKELVLNSNPTSSDRTFTGFSPRCSDTPGVYQLDLDFFGLNCRLTDAKSWFRLMPGAQNLKILHIRRGPYDGCLDFTNDKYTVDRDIVELCDCVFGPEGLPILDFVAYGDFTTSSQWHRSRKVFRRVRQPPAAFSGQLAATQVRYENIVDEEIESLPDLSCFLTSLKACHHGE